MTLPVLNTTPSYKMTIPSTGQEVTFRPYLVGEEKLLLLAAEAGDIGSIARAVTDVLKACIEEPIEINNLAPFDIEHMFMNLRAKTVGETDTITVACSKCESYNEVEVRFDREWTEPVPEPVRVELSDTVWVGLGIPKFRDVILTSQSESKVQKVYSMIGAAIETVGTPDEVHTFSDYLEEDRVQFLESMTSGQIRKIRDFIESIPTHKLDIEFKCKSCGHVNTPEVSGIESFFG